MPEPNTPWYAWSGTVNGNKPADYVAAWKRVRKAVRAAAGGKRVKLLWSPYARSVPETPDRTRSRAYFPGAAQVDLVGASAYNFGTRRRPDLDRARRPVRRRLHGDPGARAAKPFWIAETGSVAAGGDRAGVDRRARRAAGRRCPSSPASSGSTPSDADGDFRLRDTADGHQRVQDPRPGEVRMSSAMDKQAASKVRAKRTPSRPSSAPPPPALPAAPRRASTAIDLSVDEPGDGRPPVLARRLRPDRRRPRDAGPASRVGRRASPGCSTTPGRPVGGTPGTRDGKPLDPTGDDTDLVLSWVDRMVRTTNPFVERLTFFWHRHFANSRDGGLAAAAAARRRTTLFRRYSDFGANPAPTFRDLAYEVTEDPAMLRFLTGESNVARRAERELRPRADGAVRPRRARRAPGSPNYSENDVKQLAKALSGWQIDDGNPDAAKRVLHASRWYNGPKIVFGKLGNYKDREAVDLVLGARRPRPVPGHKLWGEFIATPLDAATLRRAGRAPTPAAGCSCARCCERILGHPRAVRLDRRAEHRSSRRSSTSSATMRALGVGDHRRDGRRAPRRDGPGPLLPADGGGLGGRAVVAEHQHRAGALRVRGRARSARTRRSTTSAARRAAAAFDRAHRRGRARPGSPTGTPDRAARLRARAPARPPRTPARERQLVLRTLILAGPDAQVM